MKKFRLTISLLLLSTSYGWSATEIVNGTDQCMLQLFNEHNNNAPLTLDLQALENTASQGGKQHKPSFKVMDQGVKINIGSYNTWECDNYISTFHNTSFNDECVEVYVNKYSTTTGETSVPGELQVRPCNSEPTS